MPSYIKSLKSNLGDLIIPRTTATAVTYDNSTSGLEAINAQAAIDEMMGKGWISSEDAIPSDPAVINADSLGGLPAADYATNESVDNKISSLDSDSVNAANKDLSNLSDYQKALYNIGGRPNENLVINWFFGGGGSQLGFDFFPINQRGLTEYVQDSGAGNAYGPDNWVLEAGSSIALKSTHMEFSTGANAITQPETKEFLDKLVGKQVTVSCLTLENELATATGIVKDFSQNTGISARFSGGAFAFVVFPNVAVQVGRFAGSGNIVACKVEEGPIQTLAYKDSGGVWRLFETPNFKKMLSQCQLYRVSINCEIFSGCSTSAGQAFFEIPIPFKMRKLPVIEVSGSVYARYEGNDVELSGLRVQSMYDNSIAVIADSPTSIPPKISIAGYVSSGGSIALSAEL